MIDWNRIRELTDEIGPDDLAEVVGLFLSEVEEVLTRVVERRTPDQLAADLHFLKGSAWNLGFAAFADACARCEKAALAKNTDGLDLDALARTYRLSVASFKGSAEEQSGERRPNCA